VVELQTEAFGMRDAMLAMQHLQFWTLVLLMQRQFLVVSTTMFLKVTLALSLGVQLHEAFLELLQTQSA